MCFFLLFCFHKKANDFKRKVFEIHFSVPWQLYISKKNKKLIFKLFELHLIGSKVSMVGSRSINYILFNCWVWRKHVRLAFSILALCFFVLLFFFFILCLCWKRQSEEFFLIPKNSAHCQHKQLIGFCIPVFFYCSLDRRKLKNKFTFFLLTENYF